MQSLCSYPMLQHFAAGPPLENNWLLDLRQPDWSHSWMKTATEDILCEHTQNSWMVFNYILEIL